ncbi:hypothetical protein BO70DRAFT_146303 [Aspergillus heteromorphus CBS 117.55]|uniref:DUF7719 domain-containing protein n=1 Tax=Aspergillus heteromorphus CBS 117.55 TaxID=1448321 RepID=A0A317V6Z0_9EURO|nr:uncharacterized protein BO70DRAFT_146303 [Aspergillus heteromorphus CBS 117.55]PWY69785.1 hypothetical protein BO70DRAFT_146303 [Aspergillus heteromorphus CBS 117.55]
MEGSRNRKQRRAAATAATTANSDAFDPSTIPLSRPPPKSSSNAKERTLMDIISERQSELIGKATVAGAESGVSPGTRFVTVDPTTGEISGLDPSELAAAKGKGKGERVQEITEDASSDDDAQSEENEADPEHLIPPVIDTLLLSVPLTTLHMTLSYLAAHQYAEKIELDIIVRESLWVAFPMLTFLIHLAHGHVISFFAGASKTTETISLFPWDSDKLSLEFFRKLLFPPALRTLVFLPLAIFLGCKLMVITNEDPYYAVMKGAPAIGTMWIWSILEISVGAAVLGALVPLTWGVWWMGYGIL